MIMMMPTIITERSESGAVRARYIISSSSSSSSPSASGTSARDGGGGGSDGDGDGDGGGSRTDIVVRLFFFLSLRSLPPLRLWGKGGEWVVGFIIGGFYRTTLSYFSLSFNFSP